MKTYKTVYCSQEALETKLNTTCKDGWHVQELISNGNQILVVFFKEENELVPNPQIFIESGISLIRNSENYRSLLKEARPWWKFWCLLALLFNTTAQAQWFDVSDLNIQSKFFTGHSNDYVHQAIGRQVDKELNLGLNVDFFDFMYFDNHIVARSGCINGSVCQFDEIAYKFEVGARVFSWLDLTYGHESLHALDNKFGYEVEDYIGFRINLIKHEKKDFLLW
jgi:hypothetical protein